jgi:hypothetical protein
MIDVVNWAAQTTTMLAPYGTVPKLTDPSQWKSWASVVINIPSIAALGPPRPEPYAEWQDWARQFNQTVKLLTV